MKAVGVMSAACVASGLLVSVLFAPQVREEVLLGMLMPLLVACVSLVLADKAYREDPRLLTPFMVKAFIGKMVAFGLYVVLVVAILGMEPRPFVVSFTAYFVVLYLFEALWLRRMFRTAEAQ